MAHVSHLSHEITMIFFQGISQSVIRNSLCPIPWRRQCNFSVRVCLLPWSVFHLQHFVDVGDVVVPHFLWHSMRSIYIFFSFSCIQYQIFWCHQPHTHPLETINNCYQFKSNIVCIITISKVVKMKCLNSSR